MACQVLHWLLIVDVIVLLVGGPWGGPAPAYWNPARWFLAVGTFVVALMCLLAK